MNRFWTKHELIVRNRDKYSIDIIVDGVYNIKTDTSFLDKKALWVWEVSDQFLATYNVDDGVLTLYHEQYSFPQVVRCNKEQQLELILYVGREEYKALNNVVAKFWRKDT